MCIWSLECVAERVRCLDLHRSVDTESNSTQHIFGYHKHLEQICIFQNKPCELCKLCEPCELLELYELCELLMIFLLFLFDISDVFIPKTHMHDIDINSIGLLYYAHRQICEAECIKTDLFLGMFYMAIM